MSDLQKTERDLDAERIAQEWLSDFGAALDRRDVDAAARLFAADGWWRDLLALTWDLRSLHGADAIRRSSPSTSSAPACAGFAPSRKAPAADRG